MGRKLYVGNLPFETSETELQEFFAQAGAVDSVRVMRDMATGRARGFAFVEMSTDVEAQAAVNQFHEQQFGGRTLTVNEARPQTPRSGGGGRSGGYGGEGGVAPSPAGEVRYPKSGRALHALFFAAGDPRATLFHR